MKEQQPKIRVMLVDNSSEFLQAVSLFLSSDPRIEVAGHYLSAASALADLDRLSIDLVHLQVKRDRMVAALREMGYQLHMPEATFYLLPKSPDPDDLAFVKRLQHHKVLCLPGSVAEISGYFRISITASDAMIDRSLAGFKAAIEPVRI